MNEILKTIEDSGIKVKYPEETKIKAIGDCAEFENCKLTITAYPSYRENIGFYHVKSDDWEILFVKGVYKGNIRKISGECPYEERKLNEIAQTLADVERTLRQPATVSVAIDNEDKHYICAAEKTDSGIFKAERRDYHIRQPLTPVETSLGRNSHVNEKHLFSKSPFTENFPEALSPFAISIADMVPDVFNPLFMSCDIKTQSPSMKMLFGRPYLNVNNIGTVITAFYEKSDFFLRNWMPAIYKTIKKPSFSVPNDSALKISDDEITASIEDLVKAKDDLKQEDIFSDEFVELTALTVMTWEMIYIRLWKSFMELHKLIGRTADDTLRHIYKTRKDTILNKDIEFLTEGFDPTLEPSNFKSLNLEHKDIEEMYKSIPATRRIKTSKGKYAERVSTVHKYLKMRDDMYLLTSAIVLKIRSILIETGEKLVDESIFFDKNDIFYFEHKELNNIINDEFYGNVPFTLNFRKWQNARYGALCLPYDIYEKDIERAEEVAQSQISKSEKEKVIPCMSFFNKDMSTEKFKCAKAFQLSAIKNMEGTEFVVTETATMFSHITEYCAVTDTPLYTGARFASLLLKGRKVKTSELELGYE